MKYSLFFSFTLYKFKLNVNKLLHLKTSGGPLLKSFQIIKKTFTRKKRFSVFVKCAVAIRSEIIVITAERNKNFVESNRNRKASQSKIHLIVLCSKTVNKILTKMRLLYKILFLASITINEACEFVFQS